ncbi:marvel domain-containing protein [Tuber borchii]|uniref:Marvel domain-containing protein n=1 Tax=Tuber borchii TaxID=42251 RepID=A0A2T7A6B7_TUBBO|nr:marvel domain-containing protein [Tuber borchii]
MLSLKTISTALLRLAELTFTIIILGLSGALIEQQARGGTPTRVNFSIFAAVFAILTLLVYLIPATLFSKIEHPVASTTLDGLNCVFLLSAGIAMAAQLGGKSCGLKGYLLENGITNGGGYISPSRRCREANAMTAFHWFAFAAFLASFGFSAYGIRGMMRRSGSDRGRGPMSQV